MTGCQLQELWPPAEPVTNRSVGESLPVRIPDGLLLVIIAATLQRLEELPNLVQLIFELVNPVLVRLKNFFQFMAIAFVLSLLVAMPSLLQFSRCVMGDLF
jgi:hypothetical protein